MIEFHSYAKFDEGNRFWRIILLIVQTETDLSDRYFGKIDPAPHQIL